jgi:hypothetical protein
MGKFFHFHSNCEVPVKFDLFGEISMEWRKNLFTHGYTGNTYLTRWAVRVLWNVPLGVVPAKCWPYVMLTISGRRVVAEVSIERGLLARSGTYAEAPGGCLPLHGGHVMEATAKRSVIYGLNSRLSTIHWHRWYMGPWTQREVVVCKVRWSGSSIIRLHVVTDMPIPRAKFCNLGQQQSVTKLASCFIVWPHFLL